MRNLLKSNLFLFVLLVSIVSAIAFYYKDFFCGTKNSNFLLKKIVFDGNEKVNDSFLLNSSGLRYKSNIFSADIYDVKNKLESIPWVKSVAVQRRLPDMISIRISERIPIAILQSKYKLYLVDVDGVVLESDSIKDYCNLPIIVGDGAETEIADFLYQLDKFPKIRKQLIFAVRIGKRRWDIKINKGVTVKLPEQNIRFAFKILDEISDSDGLFNEDIEIIDLRIHDRITINKKNLD